MITAAVVDEIMRRPPKNEDRFEQLTKSSVEALKKRKEFRAITENNFQQAPGGKIQMLIGQNVGQDFFPREIATFTCGLRVSMHRIQLHDETRYLGFSGRFPAQFSPMYSINDHPKALAIKEYPQQAEHEEEQVFCLDASAPPLR